MNLHRSQLGVGVMRSLRELYPSRRQNGARLNMFVIALAYLIMGLSLVFQPARWSATPAYHNLLEILTQLPWGCIFIGVAVLLICAATVVPNKLISFAALTAGSMLSSSWAIGFIVRWATSVNTTPETIVSWLVFDFVLLRAAFLMGDDSKHIVFIREDHDTG